jgi:hypothetical protein
VNLFPFLSFLFRDQKEDNAIPAEILPALSLLDQLVSKERISELIYQEAARYHLEPELIAAIIYQESKGKVSAFRYENGFYLRYVATKTRSSLQGHVPGDISLATEKRARAFSFGLMQIMGQTARENHYAKTWFELFEPEININLGCFYYRSLLDRDVNLTIAEARKHKFFKKFLAKVPHTEDEQKIRALMALLRYNGGGNLEYPLEVWGHKGSARIGTILIKQRELGL